MIENKVYKNIFEAIKAIDPGNTVLEAFKTYHNTRGGISPLKLNHNYAEIKLSNGKTSYITNPHTFIFLRGENKFYKTCQASIFRERDLSKEKDNLLFMIDEIKILDFIDIIKDFPQIKYCERHNYYINYIALAQHYGLNTNYIDLTSDLIAAAFFATHKYSKGKYAPIIEGNGYLKGYIFPNNEDSFYKMRLIGLQPFLRPGHQNAFAYECTQNDDLNKKLQFCVSFKQDLINDYLFTKLFEGPKKGFEKEWPRIYENPLFPDEAEIIEVANRIKKSNTITLKNTYNYCINKQYDYKVFLKQINKRGDFTTENAIYTLDKEKELELKLQMNNKPFGDINIFSVDNFPIDRTRKITWPINDSKKLNFN